MPNSYNDISESARILLKTTWCHWWVEGVQNYFEQKAAQVRSTAYANYKWTSYYRLISSLFSFFLLPV